MKRFFGVSLIVVGCIACLMTLDAFVFGFGAVSIGAIVIMGSVAITVLGIGIALVRSSRRAKTGI